MFAMIKKARGVLMLASAGAGLFSAVRRVRDARGRSDRLMLANAVASGLLVVTSAAITIRDLRKKDADK